MVSEGLQLCVKQTYRFGLHVVSDTQAIVYPVPLQMSTNALELSVVLECSISVLSSA